MSRWWIIIVFFMECQLSDQAPIRLVNGTSPCAGRVEIFYQNRWGPVCDDDWTSVDGQVVCRQLNCGLVVSAPQGSVFGFGTGLYWLDDVNCNGAEAQLSECPARPWGQHNCGNSEAAGVVCSDRAPIRLVNGTSRCAGRVEIFYQNRWGPVCDDYWTSVDGQVVCRQLNCGLVVSAPPGSVFGFGTGLYWLDDVNCNGAEAQLSECPARPWGQHNCGNSEAAGVVCSDHAPIRLVNGTSPCAGRVEIFYQNRWGPICDDGWTSVDGQVVCRQLNCGLVVSAPQGSVFGFGTGLFWLNDVNCNGAEAQLSECPARPWGQHNCGNSKAAGVVCSVQNPIRLVNGPSRCAGKVEIFYKDHWGPVCDDYWSSLEGEVVCRQLSCGVLLSAPGRSVFGSGTDYLLGDVQCQGTEDELSKCTARPWGQHNCGASKAASAVCSGDLPKPNISISASSSRHRQLTCTLPPLHQSTSVKFYKIGSSSPIGTVPLSAQGRVAVHTITGSEASIRARYRCQYEVRAVQTAELFISTQSDTAKVDGADANPIRLVNGSRRCAGRVEISYQNRWGPVCDNYWSSLGGEVVCRQLACGVLLSAPGRSVFGFGSNYWLDDVQCNGTEAELSECQASPWGQHNCGASKSASAVCSGDLPKPNISISSSSSGHRQLTCTLSPLHQSTTVKFYKIGSSSPIGTVPLSAQGRVAVHTITGSEASIRARYWCQYEVRAARTAQLFTSTQSDTAKVDGADANPVRLVFGSSRCAGRVEIFYQDRWGQVCDDYWSSLGGEVVCRQLACGVLLSAPGQSVFGFGSNYWLDDVQCQGTEVELSECPARPWGQEDCGYLEAASAVCSGDLPKPNISISASSSRDRQLTCTLPPLHQSTTVKFYKMGSSSPIGTVPLPAQGRVAVHTITGSEASIRARYWCQYEVRAARTAQLFNSTQSDTAKVDGADVNPIRLVNGSSRCAGRVEIFYQDRWGPVCDDYWSSLGGEVVCKQLSCGVLLSAPGRSVFGFGTNYLLDDVQCQGREAELSECLARPWGQHNCGASKAASAVCSGDLPKPSISISANISEILQLTCTLPSLHQNTTVHFYKMNFFSPIGTVPLPAEGTVAVHNITGVEISTWAQYWCQYEVMAARTAELFKSSQSDTATVEGASSGFNVTVVAASIVASVVILAVIIAGLIFLYKKRQQSDPVVENAGSTAENNTYDMAFNRGDQANAGEHTTDNREKIQDNPTLTHIYENYNVTNINRGPDTPHIYEHLSGTRTEPRSVHHDQTHEESGGYAIMIKNNDTVPPSRSKTETSIYQGLCKATLKEPVYETLKKK